VTVGPPKRPTWDFQARLDAELSRRTPVRSKRAAGAGAVVPRGWAPDVATEDGLRDLQRKIDSSPPTFQRGLEVLGLPDLREAGTSRSEEPLAMAAFLTLWLAGLAAAAWVAWAIFGSPPAVAGWLVLMCVVIAVGVFATAAFWPDRGMELPFDPDARRRPCPPAAGDRWAPVRARASRRRGHLRLACLPGPASEPAIGGAR